MQRVKYPLTTEAKEAARYLVEAWDYRKIPQYINVNENPGGGYSVKGVSKEISHDFILPPIDVLLELSDYNLLKIDSDILTTESVMGVPVIGGPLYYNRWRVLLMQELRNAVENGFHVSDYFLTFNAVGTIIQGDATISAPFQSSASIYGDISQQITSSEAADRLLHILGTDLLQSDPQLNDAIQQLKTSLESERESKLGKVISQLGRCLEHASNAKGVIEAIAFVSMILSQVH